MASLHRRTLLAAAPAALLAGCEPKMRTTVSTTPKIALAQITDAVAAIAERARPGVLGVGLSNLESGQVFFFNSERRFPMQSVFKLPLAAAVLAEVDAGRVLLTERFFLLDTQLSVPYSPIAAAWPERREYSAQELLEAIIVDSDNTAADVLMKRIGGPGALMAWLTAQRVPEVRIDRYEREIASEAFGMASYRPDWRKPEAFSAAVAAVPPERRAEAQARYLADPRDTATPRGMIEFLQLLDGQELISPASTRLLLQLMARTTRGNGRIRAGLPANVFLAHRAGTGAFDLGRSTAHNDVGVFTLADKRSYALAVFLSGSTLDDAGCDRVIAQVAGAALKAVG